MKWIAGLFLLVCASVSWAEDRFIEARYVSFTNIYVLTNNSSRAWAISGVEARYDSTVTAIGTMTVSRVRTPSAPGNSGKATTNTVYVWTTGAASIDKYYPKSNFDGFYFDAGDMVKFQNNAGNETNHLTVNRIEVY